MRNNYCCFGPLLGPFLPPVSCFSLVLLLNNGCNSEIKKIHVYMLRSYYTQVALIKKFPHLLHKHKNVKTINL